MVKEVLPAVLFNSIQKELPAAPLTTLEYTQLTPAQTLSHYQVPEQGVYNSVECIHRYVVCLSAP